MERRNRAEPVRLAALLAGGGEMGERIWTYDWAATPLGPLEDWPPSLRTAVDLLLAARQPVYVAWGPALTSLYNDGYIPILGAKHPDGLGQPYAVLFAEIWEEYRPIVAATLAGEAQHFIDQPVALVGRGDARPLSYFTFSWTPLRDAAGQVAGFYCAATETTEATTEARRGAEALRASEQLRRIALEGGRMGAWRWDTQTQMCWGDAAFLALWGLAPVEGTYPVSTVTSRMTPEGALQIAATMARDHAPDEEFDEQREVAVGLAAGRWVRWRGRAERARPWIINGVSFDVTEQRRTEAALQESAERQALLLKLSDVLRLVDGVIEIQEIAAGLVGSALNAGRAYFGAFDEQSVEMVVRADYSRDGGPSIVGSHRISSTDIMRELVKGLPVAIADIETAPMFSDASRKRWAPLGIRSLVAVPLVKAGLFAGALIVTDNRPRDWDKHFDTLKEVAERTWAVVERARAEAALRESELRLRAVIEEAPLAMALTGSSGEILFRNPRFDELWGRPADVTTARTYSEVYEGYHLDGRRIASEEWPGARAVLTGEVIENEVYEIVQAGGRRIACWFGAVPIRAALGEIAGAVVVFRDVTEERRTEAALREVNRRMEAFLSIATHELRTPVTSIHGNLQLIARRMQQALGQPQASANDSLATLTGLPQLVQVATTQTARLGRMIADLLDMARIQSDHLPLQMKAFDLVELVRPCVEAARLGWPARMITLEVPDGGVRVEADADRIEQVVTNYLTNALKYSAPDTPVVAGVRTMGDAARVQVRDQGPGLSPEQQQVVWERYQRVHDVAVQDDPKGSSGGLGLGLYISRMIILRHGGEVGVESTPGHGSTFWFTLPRSQ